MIAAGLGTVEIPLPHPHITMPAAWLLRDLIVQSLPQSFKSIAARFLMTITHLRNYLVTTINYRYSHHSFINER